MASSTSLYADSTSAIRHTLRAYHEMPLGVSEPVAHFLGEIFDTTKGDKGLSTFPLRTAGTLGRAAVRVEAAPNVNRIVVVTRNSTDPTKFGIAKHVEYGVHRDRVETCVGCMHFDIDLTAGTVTVPNGKDPAPKLLTGQSMLEPKPGVVVEAANLLLDHATANASFDPTRNVDAFDMLERSAVRHGLQGVLASVALQQQA